jgi:L-fucono-1,5-lactonase
MKIDAHQHYWKIGRGDYGWLTPALAPIYRDFSPGDLAPYLNKHGIAATILVQAAPTEAETAYLLDLASVHETIAGVIGWADLADIDAPARIEHLARNPLLVGLRPMLHDLPDDRWLLQPALAAALETMQSAGLVFDALIRPRHISVIDTIAARHPGLRIVVDHGAKPEIAAVRLDPWQTEMTALARHRNVSVKMSGLVTEAKPNWTVADLSPFVRHLLDVFGTDRIAWGSDWPVLLLAGDYDRWWAASQAMLAYLSQPDCAAIFGGNAARTYLETRGRPPC